LKTQKYKETEQHRKSTWALHEAVRVGTKIEEEMLLCLYGFPIHWRKYGFCSWREDCRVIDKAGLRIKFLYYI
jgi:hypothetical protein